MRKYIVFEGIVGCGKSTLVKKTSEWLKSQNINTETIEEPGKIQDFNPDFHAQAIKQIERVDPKEWMEFSKRFNDLANRTNYYTALFVSDGK